MCQPHEHLLPDEEGRPPWRRASFRPLAIGLSVFAFFDVALIALIASR